MIDPIDKLLDDEGRPRDELRGLVRLMRLFATLPLPPDPHSLYPGYEDLHAAFVQALNGPASDGDRLEEAFLALYAHVHGHDVPLTIEERARFKAQDAYVNHVGGLSPILRAGPFIGPDTVSADYGAGNGLQCLLMMVLHPHRRTVQIEISSRLVESGRALQRWLGVPEHKVQWITGDICDVPPMGIDLLYLYRPVRPGGAGDRFYRGLAAQLESEGGPEIILSVADCLGPFLSDRFEVFESDGHLTCFRRVTVGA